MQIAYPHAFQGIRGIAQFGGGCGIGKEQTAFGVSHDNNVGDEFKERSVVRLVLGQGDIRSLARNGKAQTLSHHVDQHDGFVIP
jgi:hypothetical protein